MDATTDLIVDGNSNLLTNFKRDCHRVGDFVGKSASLSTAVHSYGEIVAVNKRTCLCPLEDLVLKRAPLDCPPASLIALDVLWTWWRYEP